MEAFRDQLTMKIVEHVKALTCSECNGIRTDLLSDKKYSSECGHNPWERVKYDIAAFTNRGYLEIWMRYAPVESIENYDRLTQQLYNVPEVVNNIDVFLRVASILAFFHSTSPFIPHILSICIRIVKELPCVTICELAHVFRQLATQHPMYTPDAELNEFENAFVARIREIHQLHIHPAWNSWVMDDQEYTEYIQWLPREMMEDVTQLTDQKCSIW